MPFRSRRLSTGVKLALVQAAILIGAFYAAAWSTDLVTKRGMRADVKAHVAAEASALADEFTTGGSDGLAMSIRIRSRRQDGFYYRLSKAGRAVAGNLTVSTPMGLGWGFIDRDGVRPTSNPELSQDLLIFSRQLADGEILSVAADLSTRERLRGELMRSLTWCGLLATVGGLAASLLAYGGVLRRVDAVADAARAATSGRMDVRAPVRKAWLRDDIDDLADAFNQMLDQINMLVRNIRQVSADIAHDLRTPLARVRQKLDRLSRNGASNGNLSKALDSIDADIAEALRTFDVMLRLAEIESGRSPSAQQVNLAELAGRVAEAYLPDAEQSGRRLQTDLHPAVAWGEPELITQALANLLDNALRHTPPGTWICVQTGQKGGPPFIVVTDNGPGIPQDMRKAVLQRFVRLENSRTTSGTGLGLAIVAAIAERHGSSVSLSDADPGLSVRWMFPA